ncbi:MAG TPA: glycosyltransferase [Caulobacteraceae bacterium]|nr:glycosyltransferase [Caulobacteraceae bacterium]
MAAAALARVTPKVLHVVGVMDRWSVETWLLQLMARAGERSQPLDWTFYCAFGAEGSRDCEARALGARVIRSPVPIGDKLAFAKALRAEVASGGYDVLHCHHDLISGVYLLAAAGLPVSKRLVHVHNLDEAVLTPNPLKKAVLRPTLRRICLTLADQIVANSEHSLAKFLAGRRRDPHRHRVHYIAVDPTRFATAHLDRIAFRRSLGIAEDAPILLFAGRVTPEKNPVFAVDVLAALRRRMPEAVGVFAGAGSLEPDVQARAAELGQTDAVRSLGWRDDVAEIMSACDWFILPHPHHPAEGFGIAVVEAQLTGLRMLLSLGVSDAPILPGASWRRLSLDDGAEAWADAAVQLWNQPPPSRDAALAALHASPMDLDRALDDMLALHTGVGASV